MKKKGRVVLALAVFGLCILGYMKFRDDIWPQVSSSAGQVSQAVSDTYDTVTESGK
jgi:hypothetical protein